MSTEASERYEKCDVCGASIDTFDAGYYKSSNDETFRHGICHEEGTPPTEYVLKADEDETGACTNHVYNCGHAVYLPQSKVPMYCPECNPAFPKDLGTDADKQVEPEDCTHE